MIKDKLSKPLPMMAVFSLVTILITWVMTRPAIFPSFNLIGKGDIGSVIGGITTPLVGIVSIYFLYQALTKQIENNIEQQKRNEIDLILSLLNQLENELSTFYYKYSQRDRQTKIEHEYVFRGNEGLDKFISDSCYHSSSLYNQLDIEFGDMFEGKQIIMLLNSYSLIKERISVGSMDDNTKQILYRKLYSYYEARLKYAVEGLQGLLGQNHKMIDDYAKVVIDFNPKHT